MTWFGIFLALLAALGGLMYLARLRAGSPSDHPPVVDDDAIRRILEQGTLSTRPGVEDEDDGDEGSDRLDLDEAARAEEEFWDESWDEPEEYPR